MSDAWRVTGGEKGTVRNPQGHVRYKRFGGSNAFEPLLYLYKRTNAEIRENGQPEWREFTRTKGKRSIRRVNKACSTFLFVVLQAFQV